MEEHIKYLGSYRPKSEDFLHSTVTINGGSHHVWDAVGATADGYDFARIRNNAPKGGRTQGGGEEVEADCAACHFPV